MSARRFFLMLEVARELKAEEKVDLTDICALPLYGKEYHNKLVELFKGQVPWKRREIELTKLQIQARNAAAPAPKMGEKDTAQALAALFRQQSPPRKG